MEKDLADYNIDLSVCCEKDLLEAMPQSSSISGSSCVPGDIIQKLFGGRLSLKKDAGQRVKAGCGCTLSSDIGSYRLQPCYHNCLFCYANPASAPGGRWDVCVWTKIGDGFNTGVQNPEGFVVSCQLSVVMVQRLWISSYETTPKWHGFSDD